MICPILIFSLLHLVTPEFSWNSLMKKMLSRSSLKALLNFHLFPKGGQHWMSREGCKDRTTLISCSAGALVCPSAASGSVLLSLRRCLCASFGWAALANLWLQNPAVPLAANYFPTVLFLMSFLSWNHTTARKMLRVLVPAGWNSYF